MRNKFIEYIAKSTELGKDNYLVVADLGYSVIEPFKEQFPNRFINVGVAEQNMASLAAGLALEGGTVYCYSIGNFPLFRCAEQLRNNIGYHKLRVCIVAVGGGLAYGSMGYSHHAIEDFALVRTLPNFEVMAPCSPMGVERALMRFEEHGGPAYLRLHKANEPEPVLLSSKYDEILFLRMVPGGRRIILTTGFIAQRVNKMSLRDDDTVALIEIWNSKARKEMIDVLDNYEDVLVVEDHILHGGFCTWVLETLMENGRMDIKVSSLHIERSFDGMVGDEDYLLSQENIFNTRIYGLH